MTKIMLSLNYIKNYFTLAGLFFVITANTQTTAAIHQLDKLLKELQEEKNLPSVSYAIIKDQKLVYSNAVGFANLEKKIPATDSTSYSIASLTKPIAATLIMRLAEEGKIDIDKKMRDYWPGYTDYFSTMLEIFTKEMPSLLPYIENYHFKDYDITVRQHLTHTSEFVPGTRYKYNGYLFGRLVNVVDNIVPQKFIGLVDSCIVKRLGMKNSFLQFVDIQGQQQLSKLAKPYQHEKDQLIPKGFPDPRTLNTGAGFICSVKDLAAFDIAFDRNELVTAETKTKMLTAAKGPDGIAFPYGLGWFITEFEGQKAWYHYGLQETYSGVYIKLPEKKLTLILLCNSSDLTLPYNTAFQNGKLEDIPYVKKMLEIF